MSDTEDRIIAALDKISDTQHTNHVAVCERLSALEATHSGLPERISALEQWQSRLKGAIAVVTTFITVLGAYITKKLFSHG